VRVVLRPLSVEDVRRFVGSMLDTDDVSGEFAEFLHQRTDGIPLTVEETVRLLRERHYIFRQGSGWTRRPWISWTFPRRCETRSSSEWVGSPRRLSGYSRPPRS